MKKKEKIERAVAKLGWDTPEGKRLAGQIARREKERREGVDDIVGVGKFIGLCTGIAAAVCLLLAALICPLYFYGDNSVNIVATNLSDSDYAYILRGDSNLHVKYSNEQRNLNDSTIIFTMFVSHSWTIKDIMVEFLDNGNLGETVEFYYEEEEK